MTNLARHMTAAAARTLPMFPEDNPESPAPPPGPTVRTLRRRLWKAALAWYRDECGYEDVLAAARALDQAED